MISAPPEGISHTTRAATGGEGSPSLQELGGKEVRQLVRQLSVLRPWRAIAAICLEWALIFFSFFVAFYAGVWWAWPLAGIVIGTRQQALSIMLHDGVHRRLLPSVPWNDFVADFFCGLPLGISLEKNRKLHLTHHRNLGTMQDPDFAAHVDHPEFTFPMSRRRLFKGFLKDFTGVRLLARFRDMGHYSPFSRGDGWISWIRGKGWKSPGTLSFAGRIRSLAFVALLLPAIGVAALYFGGWMTFLKVILLWHIPHMFVLPALMRMRSLAEHERCEGIDDLERTRHVQTGILGRLTVAPWNMNCHVAHHLYPSVPFYNLERMHQALMKVSDYSERCVITPGYGIQGLFDELTGDYLPPVKKAA